MRYEHYRRVVVWDRLQRFPHRKHKSMIPKIKKVTRVWSLIGVGFKPEYVPAAWTGLERITGQKPVRVKTKKSVAQRRLKEGDPVACMVSVTGKRAYDRREQWEVRVLPEIRPFSGYKLDRKKRGVTELPDIRKSTKEDLGIEDTRRGFEDTRRGTERSIELGDSVVDDRGQLTFHMEQPGGIPARASYYEAYFNLVLGSSGNNAGGRYISVHTTARTKEEGVGLREGRRFPLK